MNRGSPITPPNLPLVEADQISQERIFLYFQYNVNNITKPRALSMRPGLAGEYPACMLGAHPQLPKHIYDLHEADSASKGNQPPSIEDPANMLLHLVKPHKRTRLTLQAIE